MPPAIGGSLTINFDTGINSVTMFGTTITTSGNSIEGISADDGTSYTGTFVLNSGYAIDTIVYSGNAGGGTLSGYTENDFSLVAGTGGISGTLTVTTKEASDPYNITISKPKIVIHCEGKAMADNLVITNEVYMGEFEEIFNGYTLTLEGTLTQYLDEFSYSLDGGISYTKVNSLPVTIEEVTKIKFKMSTTYELFVGIESSDSSIDLGWFPDDETIETEEIEITSNTTLEIISNIV